MAFQITDDEPAHFTPLVLLESNTQQKFAPTSPHLPTKMASESIREANHGQSVEHGSFRPVQPCHVLQELTKILQEREKLRKERDVYLQRTQYLAKEQKCFQDLLRDLVAVPVIMVNHEELQQARQLLERIESALVFFQRADESAKSQLLRLQQQEAMLLGHPTPCALDTGHPPPDHPWASDSGHPPPDHPWASDSGHPPPDHPWASDSGHPPPDHPWASDSDILLPDQEEVDRQQQVIAPPSCTPLPQPSPQEPPHHDPPRTDPQPPLTATLRAQSGREMSYIKSAKSSDADAGVKDAAVKSMIETIHGSLAVDMGQDECGDLPAAQTRPHQSLPAQQAASKSSAQTIDCHPDSLKTAAEERALKQRFSVENVLRKATMLVRDKVQSKISTKPHPPSKQAGNSKMLSDNFEMADMEEQRKLEPSGDVEPPADGTEVPRGVTAVLIKGTILRVPQKQQASVSNVAINAKKDLHLGSLKAVQGRVKKILSFRTDDVITKATMLVGDEVRFKIFLDPKTKTEMAVNVEILPDTFERKTEEQRKTGVVLGLCNSFGYIKCCQDPKLVFDLCEVMEERNLSVSEKVEFTIVPNIVAGTGNQAIRIRRLRVPTPVPTPEGSTATQTAKKITTLMNAKEKVQRDTNISSDDHNTETHVQNLSGSVDPIKTTRREYIPNTETKTSDTKTKNAHISVMKRTHRQSGGHCNLSSNRSQDKGDGIDRRLSHQSSSKEKRQEGIGKGNSNSRRRIGSTGHKSRSRSRSRGRERRESRGQGHEGKRQRRGRDRWDRRRILRRNLRRSYSSQSRSPEHSYSSNSSSSCSSRSRSRSWGKSGRTVWHRSHRSSSSHRERGSRDRRSGSTNREYFHRKRKNSSRERSREGNRKNNNNQDGNGVQRWNHSPEHRNEKSRRRNSNGEYFSRKHRRSSPRTDSPIAKVRKVRSCSKTSDTTPCRTHETDSVQNEGTENFVKSEKEKEMELEELEALIAQRMAENASLEQQMASIDFDPENENDCTPEPSQTDQENAVPHNHRSPKAAHRDELYDPFLMDKEYEQLLQGDNRVVQMDGLQSFDPSLKDSSVMLHGEDRDPMLCVEVQVQRQAEVDDEESSVYERGTNGCEHPLGQEKSFVPHNRKKENQTPSPRQYEQHQHRLSIARRTDKTMWICGHGQVALARRMSMWPECGIQLGSVRGLWSGKHGMTWEELVPQLLRLRNKWPLPDILIIHLGGNDINVRNTEELLSSIKEKLTLVRNIFPHCLIVWSDILPRHHWEKDMSCSGVEFDEATDRIRYLINFRVHAIVTELEGRVLTHENIGPELYHSNGIYLSDKGIQRFNQNIQEFVEKWEKEFSTTQEHLEFTPSSPKPNESSVENAKQFPHLPPLPDNMKESTSVSHSLPFTFTAPDVSSGSPPAHSSATPHSRPPQPVESGVCPLNAVDLDVTTEDSGHTIISPQEFQKYVKTTETINQPHSCPVISSTPNISSSLCPAADDEKDETPVVSRKANISLQKSQKNMISTKNSSGLHYPPSTSTQKCMKGKTYKTIWMCGHSLVNLARKLATSPMGFMKQGSNGPGIWVHHWGKPGMPWKDLMLEMRQFNNTPGPLPNMLLIHLGGNPTYMVSVKNLLKNIKRDLIQAHNNFPQCLIVWSDMLLMRFNEQHTIPHVKLGKAGEQIHEVINRKVHNIVILLGGRVITHENIGPELYIPNGNEMVISNQGIQRFKQNIQQFVNRWMEEANTASKDTKLTPESSEPTDHLKSADSQDGSSHLDNSTLHTSVTHSPLSIFPAENVSSRPVERGAPPLNPADDDLDQTQKKEDSGNTVILKEIITDCESLATANQGGIATSENMKTIWICGDSLVGWLSRTMLFPNYSIKRGQNGTKVCSYWLGMCHMSWQNLVPQMHHFKQNFPNPDMLIIHVKDDINIHKKDKEKLIRSVQKALSFMHRILPQCLIVWSDMLPQYTKKEGTRPREVVNTFHDMINSCVHAMVAKLGGTFVTHKNIGPEHYNGTGKDLTRNGIKAFKANIQDFVDGWVEDNTHIAKHSSISCSANTVRESNRKPVHKHGYCEPITGHATSKIIKTVWICGNNQVELAKRITVSQKDATGLGKIIPGMRVHWWGNPGIYWRNLKSQLVRLQQEWPLPDLVIIHLGDIISMKKTGKMRDSIREDLSLVRRFFPQCLVVWSDMMPNYYWEQGITSSGKPDKRGRAYDLINHTAHAIIHELGGRVITHDICPAQHHSYDNCQTAEGRFYQNIKQFLKKWAENPSMTPCSQSTSTVPDVSSSSPPSASTSGIPRPADGGVPPLNPTSADLDGTPEDSTPADGGVPPLNPTSADLDGTPEDSTPADGGVPPLNPTSADLDGTPEDSTPADRGVPPLNPTSADLDGTPEDSTPSSNTITSPRQSQKDVESSVKTPLPHSTPGTSIQNQEKVNPYKSVWMCGYALSGLARRMAAAQSHVINLESNSPSIALHHLGRPGMTWSDLVLQMHKFSCNQPHPDMLIIHLVASNINTTKKDDLLNALKKDLTHIHRIFPQCLIVWSDMLLMRFSKQDETPREIYEVINRTARAIVTGLGGKVITHDHFGFDLYRPSGNDMVLSEGLQRFNMNIQQFVEDWMRKIKLVSEDTGTITESSRSTSNGQESASQLRHSVSNSNNPAKSTPQPNGPKCTFTAACVSSSSPPAPADSSDSHSGPPRQADGDVSPLKSADDVTPGDSGNAIISPEQAEKNVKATETLSRSPPVFSSASDVPSNPCSAASDGMDVTCEDSGNGSTFLQLEQQQVRESTQRPLEVKHTHGFNETVTECVPRTPETKGSPKMLWMCGFALSDMPRRIVTACASPPGSKSPHMRFHQWGAPWVTWTKLMTEMSSFKHQVHSRPDMLIVHLGSRNINLKHAEFWLKVLRKDLGRTHRSFPQCLIVWSNMLPRCFWTKGMSDEAAARTIDLINRRAGAIVTELGGRVITHDNIGPDLYQLNGFQMVPNRQGMEIFKQNILRFVEEWERAEYTHTITESPELPSSSRSNREPASQSLDPLLHSDSSTMDTCTTGSLPSTSTHPAAGDEMNATPEILGNTIICPQQTQKNVRTRETINQPHSRPVNFSAPEVSSSPCPAAGGDKDATPVVSGSSITSPQQSQKTSLPAASDTPQSRDLSSSTVKQNVSLEASVKSLCTLTRQQEASIEKLMPKSAAVPASRADINVPKTKEELLKYYCLFTLNPNTAHRNLCLAENDRKAEWRDEVQPYPYHPQRFVDKCYQVLCRESVSERRYFEVEWSGSVGISLSFENKRCQKQVSTSFGSNTQSWTLQLSTSGCYYCHNNKKTKVPQVKSSRVGVYVDYKAHTLGFYSISDSATLLCSIQTKFRLPVYPGFGLSHGSSVKLL